MCGIVGYVGNEPAVPILLEALKSLEYRGYDSAGLAVVTTTGILEVRRAAGKLKNLEEELERRPVAGSYGVGHTRWATHGVPSQENAHPHRDCDGDLVVVHNGIIENYLALRKQLSAKGHEFVTDTDTEAIVHLIEEHFDNDLEAAVRRAARELQGIYALAAMTSTSPQKIVAAKQGPPLVVGLGDGQQLLASDVPPVLPYSRSVIFLDDGQIATLTPEAVTLTTFDGERVEARPQQIHWDPVTAQKGGYRHFMLKEIHEQPEAVRDGLVGRLERAAARVDLPDLGLDKKYAASISKLCLIACGTSWHAALVGKFWIEGLARLPVEVDYGSEFRYRDPLLGDGTVACAITQSGETADTLAAMREAKSRGARVWAVCNVLGSMATRIAEGVIYTQAGPEIGVASTKAFTTQLVCLYLLALRLARLRGQLQAEQLAERVEALARLPRQIEGMLSGEEQFAALARGLARRRNFLYLGRGPLYPIALEGALKLKEISYIHAEGYPAGEMKHGPIALIDRTMPVLGLAPKGPWYEKVCSNLQEVRARQGHLIALVTEGDDEISEIADDLIVIPDCLPELAPILAVVPLQLLAYHIGVRRGCDVDQPRNLAKSVTVE
ncbi:MAG: glutamine--fructose-6-phosphate transaminase (isomerizing) [Acidobacteriota bacterium]